MGWQGACTGYACTATMGLKQVSNCDSGYRQMNDTQLRCFLVEKDAAGKVQRAVVTRPTGDLPPGEVLVRVAFSSLNYKDALAAQAHPGVVRKLPHVPGIDAAGTVVESADARFRPGDDGRHHRQRARRGPMGRLGRVCSRPGRLDRAAAGGLVAEGVDDPGHRRLHRRPVRAGDRAQRRDAAMTAKLSSPARPAASAAWRSSCWPSSASPVVAVTGKPQLEVAPAKLGSGARHRPRRSGEHERQADALGSLGRRGRYGRRRRRWRRSSAKPSPTASSPPAAWSAASTCRSPCIRSSSAASRSPASAPRCCRYDRRLEIWRKLSQDWRLDGLEELATTIGLADVGTIRAANPERRNRRPDGTSTGTCNCHACSSSSSTPPIWACACGPPRWKSCSTEAARGLLAMLVANPEAVRPSRPERSSLTAGGAALSAVRLAERAAVCVRDREAAARRVRTCSHRRRSNCAATCRGEPMDPARHEMDHEVKAITYHGLRVEQTADGWVAEVIVDI